MTRIVFSLLFFLLLSAPAWALSGRVVGVADGDTITVLTANKQQIKVRLYGIDCPEKKQAYGDRARDFTGAAVFGRDVQVESLGRDRYGRTLGIVSGPSGRVLNRELLVNGLAWVYVQYCKRPECAKWSDDEAAARSARRGLWKQENPLPPWQWRKSRRGVATTGEYSTRSMKGGSDENWGGRIGFTGMDSSRLCGGPNAV